MGAISGLQLAQYGRDNATNDSVEVDYVSWASAIKGIQAIEVGSDLGSLLSALGLARSYEGLSLVHVPVYFGTDELGGMGVFGRWNVGSWVSETQTLRHNIGL
jgi:3D-(3,5/4)-trihydroxycyclohexane-1,2-dione acylhydrolase (decyclizing)